jgi:hypothetical protein
MIDASWTAEDVLKEMIGQVTTVRDAGNRLCRSLERCRSGQPLFASRADLESLVDTVMCFLGELERLQMMDDWMSGVIASRSRLDGLDLVDGPDGDEAAVLEVGNG